MMFLYVGSNFNFYQISKYQYQQMVAMIQTHTRYIYKLIHYARIIWTGVQKYNKIFSIIVNVEKNTLIALPFLVRLFQVVLFLLFHQL